MSVNIRSVSSVGGPFFIPSATPSVSSVTERAVYAWSYWPSTATSLGEAVLEDQAVHYEFSSQTVDYTLEDQETHYVFEEVKT